MLQWGHFLIKNNLQTKLKLIYLKDLMAIK